MTYLVFVGLFLFWFITYLIVVAAKPQLHYSQSSVLMKSILTKCPTLAKIYWATPWLCWPIPSYLRGHLPVLNYLVGNKLQNLDLRITHKIKVNDAGDEIGIAMTSTSESFAPDIPIVFLLNTLTGELDGLSLYVREIEQHGWRAIVLVRRGQKGLNLTTPTWSIWGRGEDIEPATDRIQELYPQAALFMAAFSAGCATGFVHLGTKKELTPFMASAHFSPGYDTAKLFEYANRLYANFMLANVKKRALLPHQKILEELPSYEKAMRTEDMQDFLAIAYELMGYESWEEFDQASNPMRVARLTTIPTLVFNAEDDPACPPEKVITYDAYDENPNLLLVQTRTGSHLAFPEGLTAKLWGARVMLEFFEAVRAQK